MPKRRTTKLQITVYKQLPINQKTEHHGSYENSEMIPCAPEGSVDPTPKVPFAMLLYFISVRVISGVLMHLKTDGWLMIFIMPSTIGTNKYSNPTLDPTYEIFGLTMNTIFTDRMNTSIL